MKNFLLKHWLKIAGAAVGALGGYLYYVYVGCVTGTCPITSNPYMSIIYGSVMGLLFFDLFKKNPKKKATDQQVDKEDNSI